MGQNDIFMAPFEVVTQHISRIDLSAERRKAANDSILADVLGLDPVPIPDSGAPAHVRLFLYSTLELYHSYHRFSDYEIFLNRYPWRGKISKQSHFAIAIFAILNESYVFEARLKKFFESMRKSAAALNCKFPSQQCSQILKAYHRTFRNFLRARGIHTHQEDFQPPELKRLALIELLSGPAGMPGVKFALPMAIRDLRKTWKKNNADAKTMVKEIMVASFRVTESIWSKLKLEQSSK